MHHREVSRVDADVVGARERVLLLTSDKVAERSQPS